GHVVITLPPNKARIIEGHTQIARLTRAISEGIGSTDPDAVARAASATLDLARIARQVAPVVEVCERYGWNGAENPKDIGDFLDGGLNPTDPETRPMPKFTFTATIHIRVQHQVEADTPQAPR